MNTLIRLGAMGLLLVSAGCESMNYAFWESFGVEKRHIMVDRVEDAVEEQEEAKEQFKTTLERFKELSTNFDGGDLEAMYNQIADDYEACEDRADAVRGRIDSIQSVADDMFEEWAGELEEQTNMDYRREGEKLLRDTERKAKELIGAMRAAESRMYPVLKAFKAEVLRLKHQLNAAAIASLEGTVLEIETDVKALIADMEASIAEANAFIASMNADA